MSAHKADETFVLVGGAGGGNSPPSAGIPRQVRYAVTKAWRGALKCLAAGLAWLVVLVLLGASQDESGSIRLLCHCGSIA